MRRHLCRGSKKWATPVPVHLGVSAGVVRTWTREGRLRAARHGRKAVWLLDPLDAQPDEIRQLAARRAQEAADRPPQQDSASRARGRRGGEPRAQWEQQRAAGKLTTPEIAVRLGIGIKTAYNWVQAGRLRGQRHGQGSGARWIFDPIDEQPESIRRLAAARAANGGRRGLLSDAAAGRGAV